MSNDRSIADDLVSGLRLYEALLWEPRSGYFLLAEHLRRLGHSARFFGFSIDLDRVAAALLDHAPRLSAPTKVRLEVERDGGYMIEDQPLRPSTALSVALAAMPVRHDDPLLRHKTSARGVYDAARASVVGVDDVVLYNERGELTETTAGNLVLELDGQRWTPALEAGLLPGTYRQHLVERQVIRPARLTTTDLWRASRLWMINSVRRRCAAHVKACVP